MRETDRTIGEIVAENYRTAQVFTGHGIDFCCGGSVTLAATCLEKGLDPDEIVREIVLARREKLEQNRDYASWTLAFLIDYIINIHHTYLKDNTGQVAAYAEKIAAAHGAKHPEVITIAAIFKKIAGDLASHLRAEEEVFFPAVKRVEAARADGAAGAAADMAEIGKSMETLVGDHEEIGEAIHSIRSLANGFLIPDDVCNTFRVTYQKLAEFEEDLHKHVHLENNILFMKVATLQK